MHFELNDIFLNKTFWSVVSPAATDKNTIFESDQASYTDGSQTEWYTIIYCDSNVKYCDCGMLKHIWS